MLAPAPPENAAPDALGRWPGGKRWLPKLHAAKLPLPRPRGRLYDPCVGAGAVAISYAKRGARVTIGDSNPRLIGVYRNIIVSPASVLAELARIASEHRAAPDPKGHYFAQRDVFNATDPASPESAAGFLFTMNAGFNGVVRFSKRGVCNTPYGEPAPGKDLVRAEEIRYLGKLLARAEVVLGDFAVTTGPAKRGDVVYFDPPYVSPAEEGKGPGFVGYSPDGFTLADRKRLGVLLRDLDHRGVRWVLSDKSADHALAVYGLWNVVEVSVTRSVAARGEKRGKAIEVLVTNF